MGSAYSTLSDVDSLVQELEWHPVNINRFFQAFRTQTLSRRLLQIVVRQYHYQWFLSPATAQPGRVPEDADRSTVARVPVIVLFMALKHLRTSTAAQQVIVTSLAGGADDAAAQNAQPAAVAVGEVVQPHEQLNRLAAEVQG